MSRPAPVHHRRRRIHTHTRATKHATSSLNWHRSRQLRRQAGWGPAQKAGAATPGSTSLGPVPCPIQGSAATALTRRIRMYAMTTSSCVDANTTRPANSRNGSSQSICCASSMIGSVIIIWPPNCTRAAHGTSSTKAHTQMQYKRLHDMVHDRASRTRYETPTKRRPHTMAGSSDGSSLLGTPDQV